ncbi:MAG: hypothetical protein AAF682_12805 [Planctomycetota bacterium]
MHKLPLALSALVACSSLPFAAAAEGGAPWNRRVIHIAEVDHGDGSSTLHAVLQTQMFQPTTAPADLTMNVEFFIEGASVGSLVVPQIVDPGAGAGGACYEECGTSTWGAMANLPGEVGGPCICTASTLASLKIATSQLAPGDQVDVWLTPADGALPEQDLGDDRLSLGNLGGPGSDGVYRREILSVSVKPSETGPGFRIETEVLLEAPELPLDPHYMTLDSKTYTFHGTEGVGSATAPASGPGSKILIIITDGVPYPAFPAETPIRIELEALPGSFPALPGIDAEVEAFTLAMPTLLADTEELSVFEGGMQELVLHAGAAHAVDLFLVMSSLSGTTPGIPIGGFVLPLNPDGFFAFSIAQAGSDPYVGSFGALDLAGSGGAGFAIPPGSPVSWVGLSMHHAYGMVNQTAGAISGVSNAVPLTLVP